MAACDGPQVLSVAVSAKIATELEQALDGSRDGALSFEADDGAYTLSLARIVYVKRFARESRVGFGSG